MSDTPSTDAIAHHGYDRDTYIALMTAHARELERENTELEAEVVGQMKIIGEQQDAAKKLQKNVLR
jgi:hypothetical protein